jgi:DNA-binding CsgD family transcriptional regulator/PAS domain-containing protein
VPSMRLDSMAFHDLIAGIYEAGLSPDLWPQIMSRMSSLFGGAGIAFGVINFKQGLLLLPEHNLSPSCLRGVREHYHTPMNNPCVKMAVATAPLSIASLESVVSDAELLRMDFYNDLLRPQRLRHGLCANLYRDRDHLVGLASYREASAGRYEGDEPAILALLLPHLNRAIRVFLRMTAIDALAQAATEIADRLPQGIILTDAAGRIGFANGAAQAILEEADGLILRDGVLRAAERREGEQLGRIIAEAAGQPSTNGRSGVRRTGAMQVTRPSMRRPLPLVVAPMQFRESAPRGPLAVSITVSDPECQPETTTDTFVRLYGLTAAEARVAVLLVQGYSPSAAAERLGVAISTVRSHIRQLLVKTETERLADFVRRILSGPGAIASSIRQLRS